MLGAAAIPVVIDQSAAFLAPLADVTGTVVDLGSGGGVPGLVVAWMRRDLRLVLVDRRATRTDHLERLVRRLGLGDRVVVLNAEAATLPRRLGVVPAVIARGFGAPDQLLGAALPLLGPEGMVVVTAPPDGDASRWMAPARRHQLEVDVSFPRVLVVRRFHGKHR